MNNYYGTDNYQAGSYQMNSGNNGGYILPQGASPAKAAAPSSGSVAGAIVSIVIMAFAALMFILMLTSYTDMSAQHQRDIAAFEQMKTENMKPFTEKNYTIPDGNGGVKYVTVSEYVSFHATHSGQ